MTRISKLLLAASATAIATVGAAPAFAAGRPAGSDIVNNVTVNFTVGSVAQTAVNASNSFKVDRKITLTVAAIGTTTTQVSPGEIAAVTKFTVSNTSNATLDLGLSVAQLTGTTAPNGGTDNFDVLLPSIYVDSNSNGSYTPGTDLLVSFLDDVAADTSKTVFVVANIPLGRATNDIAAVTLTAQARDSVSAVAGQAGPVAVQTAGADTTGIDTVFADTKGTADALRDGQYSANNDYTVSAAALSVLKTATVISDELNNTVNPKMIPGAIVAYCIQVTNATGGSAASAVTITDPMPTEMTYDTAYGIFVNGSVTTGTCNEDGSASGAFNATSKTVSGTIASVPAGATRTVLFRARIN